MGSDAIDVAIIKQVIFNSIENRFLQMSQCRLLPPTFSGSNNRFNELMLQYLWQTARLREQRLSTTTGKPLQIIFPGWFNSSWGPDFKEGRLIIDHREYFGDIEIHTDESAWYSHQHHLNQAYNRVILHVFVHGGGQPAKNAFSQVVPSLCLLDNALNDFWNRLNEDDSIGIEQVPGACGLSLCEADPSKLDSIIQQAAENRMLEKAQHFYQIIEEGSHQKIEDALYTSICRSTGYSAHSQKFVMLSQRYPYTSIKTFFKKLHRQCRVEVFSRWLGSLGLLRAVDPDGLHEDLRREWITFNRKWEEISEDELTDLVLSNHPHRPFNSPIRRLVGLYYHLRSVHFRGLFYSWLQFLQHCQQSVDQSRGRKQLTGLLDAMFPHPSWDPFFAFGSKTDASAVSSARFIGKKRQLTILVNSIIPFFLAWARIQKDRKMEKLLFKTMLSFPPEDKNHKTEFMEKRLFKERSAVKKKKHLGFQQGLIQIHDDCCTSFYEGCKSCSLLKWLSREESL